MSQHDPSQHGGYEGPDSGAGNAMPPSGGSGWNAPTTAGKATAALVCGILGFFVCPFLLGPAAIILGTSALNEIRGSGGRLQGDGMAKTARILGIVQIVLGIIGVILFVIITLGASKAGNDAIEGLDDVDSSISDVPYNE